MSTVTTVQVAYSPLLPVLPPYLMVFFYYDDYDNCDYIISWFRLHPDIVHLLSPHTSPGNLDTQVVTKINIEKKEAISKANI